MMGKEYLNDIKNINGAIKLKLGEMEWIQRMLEQIMKVWTPYFTRHSAEMSPLQKSILKLSFREQEVSEQIDALTSKQQEAQKLFDILKRPLDRSVLVHRYLEGKSFEDIADSLNCGVRWTQRVHDRAVKEFNLIYDRRNAH